MGTSHDGYTFVGLLRALLFTRFTSNWELLHNYPFTGPSAAVRQTGDYKWYRFEQPPPCTCTFSLSNFGECVSVPQIVRGNSNKVSVAPRDLGLRFIRVYGDASTHRAYTSRTVINARLDESLYRRKGPRRGTLSLRSVSFSSVAASTHKHNPYRTIPLSDSASFATL